MKKHSTLTPRIFLFYKTTCIISLLFFSKLYPQSTPLKNTFTKVISVIYGNLNTDTLPDKVCIFQDTIDKTQPYKLLVLFAQPGNTYHSIVSSTKIIDPRFPNGPDGLQNGNGFGSISINRRTLIISSELLRGHYEYKLRYQHGNFELIGYTYVCSNGLGEIHSIDFNLSTGDRHEINQRYDRDEIISDIKKKIQIKPLPKLQDIKPFENELY
ncbi:MAG: hypothetical protein JST26_13220 [Bacteroidetes bacterium]|nr:hypothetical protein [Bacteroidota bacterium]